MLQINYILSYIDKEVNILYTGTNEKVPSNHPISRHVHGRFWQFDDVEGPKG